MTQPEPHPSSGTSEDDAQPRTAVRSNPTLLVVMGLAAVLTYVAQPVVALLWAGVAIALAIIVLVQEDSARPAPIAALVLAGVGLLWTLVQLGALY